MDDLLSWIRLTRIQASARRVRRLLDAFGSPAAIFTAGAEAVAHAAGCQQQHALRLLESAAAPDERDLRRMERLGVRLLTWEDPSYPRLLRQIPDPPVALYVRGSLLERDERAVALVGSRRCADYGKRIARRLVEGLVEAGYTIVSGLALGLDTAAHQAAIDAGGRTIACLGSGVDVIYPQQNHELASAVIEAGAVISEYPLGAQPEAWHFPSRNRIVSGLVRGVVIVEAPRKSGAMITAECAVDQNRDVFAVPGNIDNHRNYGCHALIREGAHLVESVDDILAVLDGSLQMNLDLQFERPPQPKLDGDEATIFALLDHESKPMDDLIAESGLPAARVGAALVLLELKEVARRLPGNAYQKVDW